jgi:hypothetical protein
VAVWASSGVTQPYEQALMNQAFYRELVKTTDKKATPAAAARLGDVIRQAKAATADIDIRRTWILLGDPAMRLERR